VGCLARPSPWSGQGYWLAELGRTAKTVAIRAAVAGLDPAGRTVIYIGNPTADSRGIVTRVVTTLGCRPVGRPPQECPPGPDGLYQMMVIRPFPSGVVPRTTDGPISLGRWRDEPAPPPPPPPPPKRPPVPPPPPR
jgi:hypothetical protein